MPNLFWYLCLGLLSMFRVINYYSYCYANLRTRTPPYPSPLGLALPQRDGRGRPGWGKVRLPRSQHCQPHNQFNLQLTSYSPVSDDVISDFIRINVTFNYPVPPPFHQSSHQLNNLCLTLLLATSSELTE